MNHFFTIIGGMGTLATQFFVILLNERTEAKCDQEYLNYIVVNQACIPDRSEYILDNKKTNPLPELLKTVSSQTKLKPDFFVLNCNTAHYFFNELQNKTPIPILNMPDIAVKALGLKNVKSKRIGVLGTKGLLRTNIYDELIKNEGYKMIYPDKRMEHDIQEFIFKDVKGGEKIEKKKYFKLIEDMFSLGCDIVILGCTELSIAQYQYKYPVDSIIDAQSELVDETIRRAKYFQSKL